MSLLIVRCPSHDLWYLVADVEEYMRNVFSEANVEATVFINISSRLLEPKVGEDKIDNRCASVVLCECMM